jgi:hypothetical protein
MALSTTAGGPPSCGKTLFSYRINGLARAARQPAERRGDDTADRSAPEDSRPQKQKKPRGREAPIGELTPAPRE